MLSNGILEGEYSKPVYDLLGWRHEILEDTDHDLGFDVDPLGIVLVAGSIKQAPLCGLSLLG